MELCSYDHDEICHSERKCPLCRLQEVYDADVKAFEQTIDDLNKEIASLRQQIP